VLVLARHRRRL